MNGKIVEALRRIDTPAETKDIRKELSYPEDLSGRSIYQRVEADDRVKVIRNRDRPDQRLKYSLKGRGTKYCEHCGERCHQHRRFCSKECETIYMYGNDIQRVREERQQNPCIYAIREKSSPSYNRQCERQPMEGTRFDYMPIYSIEDVCGDCDHRRVK